MSKEISGCFKHMDIAHGPRSFAKTMAIALVVLIFANSCTSSQNDVHDDQADSIQAGISIAAPQDFASSRNIDYNNVVVEITLPGEQPIAYQRNSPPSIAFEVRRNESFVARVEWFEFIDENKVKLASTSVRQDRVTDSVVLNVRNTQYTTAGDSSFDFDGDSFSNMEERRLETSPIDPDSKPKPEAVVNVLINAIRPEISAAPTIDGLYETEVYNDNPAQFNDNNGDRLNIGNLMVSQGDGALRADKNDNFRWLALHDNTYLYLFVLADRAEGTTINRDSDQAWQDESIDIFIDGNNSKGDTYDGVDDRQIIIPLLTSAADPSPNTTYFEPGPNSATTPTAMPPFEFATCVCNKNTWEVKLPLADFGITVGEPFGIEIQINEDYNGGPRDAKWGWFHPARVDENTDNTYLNPSFMGTAELR